MKYNFEYKITFKLNQPFDIDYMRSVCQQYPNSKILVEVQNTKGMTSEMLKQLGPNVAIRIAGAYDKERLERYRGQKFYSGKIDYSETTEEYYYNSVIYTRNETIKILEEIEKIESGMNTNWSDFQKVLYVYDRLKSGIMYDPKYEYKLSNEIRSLRGLITRQTVCAGFSLIFKEFMDRNGIECEFVRGGMKQGETSGHAWNIVTINGKKYPIDLTLDNTAFRAGKSNSFKWLSQEVKRFSESHHPAPGEKTQDYERTLSRIEPQFVKQMYSRMGIGRARDYQSTTYYGTRKDGSRFIVAQIGDIVINNQSYYRYYYVEVLKDGTKELPLILYSDVNVSDLIDRKNFRRSISVNYEETVDNILFSRENIADSLAKKTYYIGDVRKRTGENRVGLVSSYWEIPKPKEKNNLFVYPTKRFTRSDGSVFIAQKMFDVPRKVNGIDVMRYDIFEMVKEKGKEVLKRNTVFAERDFFNDNRQSMVDDYLSRERLDRKVGEAGGYIGYYDANGIRVYNPDLVRFFETSKKVDIDDLKKKSQKVRALNEKVPSFSELKSLASKYEIFIDSKDPINFDDSNIKIRDIKTGQIPTDQSIIDRAMFANIWLTSAGIKYCDGESRPGENYAFNSSAEELYNTMCHDLSISCMSNGVIDTVGLFRNAENSSDYKYDREIIVNLFRTPYQTELINKLFLQSLGIEQQTQQPETLYTSSYATSLAFGDKSTTVKGSLQ